MKNSISVVFATSILVMCIGTAHAVVLEYDSGHYKKEGVNRRGQLIYKDIFDTQKCSIEVLPIIDRRTNKLTIGAKSYHPLLSEDIDGWLDGLRADFIKAGAEKDAGRDHFFQVQLYLMKLYSSVHSLNITGTIALKAEYIIDGKIVKVERHRGYAAKTNWANGDSEYVTAVNNAAHNAVTDIAMSMNEFCNNL